MTNVGDVRTRGDLFRDRLLEGSIPTQLRYFADITVGSPTAAVEVFLNGEEGSRFYLPDNCVMAGVAAVSVYEFDQVTALEHPAGQATFSVRRLSGVITVNSTSVDSVNGSFTFAADSTNNALIATYTPPLNTRSIVTAVMSYSFSGLDLRSSNYYSISA